MFLDKFLGLLKLIKNNVESEGEEFVEHDILIEDGAENDDS